MRTLKQPFKTRPYEEIAKECGLRNKTLKQLLQEKRHEWEKNYIPDETRTTWLEALDWFEKIVREWLEQKRINEPQTDYEESINLFLRGLLEDLGK